MTREPARPSPNEPPVAQEANDHADQPLGSAADASSYDCRFAARRAAAVTGLSLGEYAISQ